MKVKDIKDAFLRSQILALKTYTRGAYTPYSDFKVACVLIDPSKHVIRARNVENASYGLSMCAERCAIYAAAAADWDLQTIDTMIIYHEDHCISMCGACC